MSEKAEVEAVIEKADDWYGESKLAKKYQNRLVVSVGIAFVTFLAIAVPLFVEYGGHSDFIYEGRLYSNNWLSPYIEMELSSMPDNVALNGVDITDEFIKVTTGPAVPRGFIVGGIIVVFIACAWCLWVWSKYRDRRIEYRNDLIMYWADHGQLMPPEDWEDKLEAEQEGKKKKKNGKANDEATTR